MTEIKDARELYLTDNHFRTLVQTINHLLKEHQFSPGELRMATTLAMVLYEQENTRRFGNL